MAGMTVIDAIDSLQVKLSQLDAMLTMSYGCAGERFRSMNAHLQDHYLLACNTLSSECVELVASLSAANLEDQPIIPQAPGAHHE